MSSTLYFGHPNNGARTVAPALEARNIDMLRAAPCDINIIVIPEAKQAAFSSYISFLPAFIMAYFKRVTLSTRLPCFPIMTPVDKFIPFVMPPLIVDFAKPLSTENTNILSEIGFDQITIQNKKTAMVFPTYNLDQLRQILNMGANTITPTTVNSVNGDAARIVILLLKICSGFFLAHNYPAYSDEDHPITDPEMDKSFERSEKRKRPVDDDDGRETTPTTASPAVVEPDENDSSTSTSVTSKEIILYRAKPPRIDTNCWGDATQIPSGSGIILPYIPDLATYDRNTVPAVIRQFFFLCLGSTVNEAIVMYDKLCSAWGIIHRTEAGNVLSHLFRVIEIALQSQSRAYPLFSGSTYNGCILSGARFKLYVRGQVYKPASYDQLQESLSCLKLHTSVLQHIAALSGVMDHSQVTDVTSMRQLSNTLMGCETSEDSRDKIKREVVHLSFPQKFWGINPFTLNRMFDLLGAIGTEIPHDVPMHPHHIFERDRVASVLSAFGYMAPTFLIPSSPSIGLVRSASAPHCFAVRTVALNSAITDMHSVLKTKKITNNPANLSKAHQDRSYNGADKTNIWKGLVDLVNSQREDNETGHDNDVGGGVQLTSSADLLDF